MSEWKKFVKNTGSIGVTIDEKGLSKAYVRATVRMIEQGDFEDEDLNDLLDAIIKRRRKH